MYSAVFRGYFHGECRAGSPWRRFSGCAPRSRYAVPQDLSVRLAEEGQAPLHLAALPSAVWDAADNTPMAPHTEAIATEGLSLAQAAPVPVPWDTAQLPTGIPPAGAMPAMPPGMVPGYPIMAPMAGMWMTVWVPYGTPMMMAPTPGMPMPNAPVPQVPGMVPFGMLPQGTVPGTGPGGMPGAAPGGYGAPMVAWPGYPAGVMPGEAMAWFPMDTAIRQPMAILRRGSPRRE